ncbi:hypothetical protein J6590_038171 [Homalodisca vitripennis]|nr:hypothetical protein J6590_038171 [Homalodisca vitripennis]
MTDSRARGYRIHNQPFDRWFGHRSTLAAVAGGGGKRECRERQYDRRTKTRLDYESIVSFTVRVVDLRVGEPQLTSDVTARVFINILDVNDCMLHFLYAEYNLSMSIQLYSPLFEADLTTRSRVGSQVEASDEDIPAVTNLRYMIFTGNKENWFHLDPESSLLQTKHETSHSLRVVVCHS